MDDRTDTITNPIRVVEFLSKSASNSDRGQTFEAYRAIPTRKEYLTVAQERRYVEHWVRQPDNSWLRREIEAGGSVSLPCIQMELQLDAIYEK